MFSGDQGGKNVPANSLPSTKSEDDMDEEVNAAL
jgi:hypothetical protein